LEFQLFKYKFKNAQHSIVDPERRLREYFLFAEAALVEVWAAGQNKVFKNFV
jgi:hypothetical protein